MLQELDQITFKTSSRWFLACQVAVSPNKFLLWVVENVFTMYLLKPKMDVIHFVIYKEICRFLFGFVESRLLAPIAIQSSSSLGVSNSILPQLPCRGLEGLYTEALVIALNRKVTIVALLDQFFSYAERRHASSLCIQRCLNVHWACEFIKRVNKFI